MSQTPLVPGEVAEFVGFKMPQADASYLAELASQAGISKSELIRRIIAERLKRETGPPDDGG